MNERIQLILNEFKQAFFNLKNGVENANDDLSIDGVIKRFELCYELSWKLIKHHLADKGLIVDFLNRKIGKKMYMLAPTVVGFFEFSMMRVRDDINQKELAKLFHKYLYEDFTFAKQAFQKKTQFGRTLVHETALNEGDYSEILSFEKATEIIKSSKSNTVSLCYCRHKASHLNEVCYNPT